ncbi:PREDICTED: lithostathine-1-alpha-like, partial [Galeopterus variegatus]|uniref:Lithostathine-1-alpha-like n=1 Tax=Galeopterus variegatus TaxID=482537 RepID=A0ABM0S648_GALVR
QEAKTELPSALISCPEGTITYGSLCYYFDKDHEVWINADLFCQNMHLGYLVSVLTQAEGHFVASLIKENGSRDFNVWIGLHDPKIQSAASFIS